MTNSGGLPIHLIVPGAMVLGGIGNLILGLVLYRNRKKEYSTYCTAQGVISGVDEEKGQQGDAVYPVLKFTVAGKEYEVRNPYAMLKSKTGEGTAVTVMYNTENPQEAEMENRLRRYMLPLLTMLGAPMSAVLAVIMYFVLTRQ